MKWFSLQHQSHKGLRVALRSSFIIVDKKALGGRREGQSPVPREQARGSASASGQCFRVLKPHHPSYLLHAGKAANISPELLDLEASNAAAAPDEAVPQGRANSDAGVQRAAASERSVLPHPLSCISFAKLTSCRRAVCTLCTQFSSEENIFFLKEISSKHQKEQKVTAKDLELLCRSGKHSLRRKQL